MNGDAQKFGFIATALAMAAGLSGCMSDPVVGASPVNAQIAAAVATPAPRPTFAAVPAPPADLREPEAWRKAVGEEEAARDRLLAAAAPETFALKGDTEAFAARTRAEATRDAPKPATAADRAASEAYAASLRQQASPPSVTPQ